MQGTHQYYTGADRTGFTDHSAAQSIVIFHALRGGVDHCAAGKPYGEVSGREVEDQAKGGNGMRDHCGDRVDRSDRIRRSGVSDRSDTGADA